MTGHFGLCDVDWVVFNPDQGSYIFPEPLGGLGACVIVIVPEYDPMGSGGARYNRTGVRSEG
eukprot:7919483-Ditylum_brightwellii.AAC.1